MISLCKLFAKTFDITFNCKKTVCIKFTDASKAFEKINYVKLFSTLLQRNMNVYCIRLIFGSYIHVRQISRVSWGNHLSQYFELSNGVKQGRVLSLILFNMYNR